LKLNFSKTDKILLSIIAALLLILICGTITGLILNKGKLGKNLRDADPEPTAKEIESLNKRLDDKIAAYTGLGTIRTITAPDPQNEDETGTVVVLTPWLAYPEGDSVFFEELARKRLLISSCFTNYFSSKTKLELLSTKEDSIKETILNEINSQLSLGSISKIYFTDYIFLE